MADISKEQAVQLAREVGATPYTNRHYPDRPTHTFTVEQLELYTKLVRKAGWSFMSDRQCSSCGGICKKSGCERENVTHDACKRCNAGHHNGVERVIRCGTCRVRAIGMPTNWKPKGLQKLENL